MNPFRRIVERVGRPALNPLQQRLEWIAREARDDSDRVRLMLGQLHAARVRALPASSPLHEVEFGAYSQWGEDGIIEHLVSRIEIPNATFVEFGVDTYRESNTRFLLMNRNWRGLIIDASEPNMRAVRESDLYWRYDLTAVGSFVTAENINGLIEGAGITGDIGILSVDIDGNDYWVWKAINVVRPRIVITEWNSVFGAKRRITTPYDPAFQRLSHHFSNLVWGASLPALCSLAAERGYAFVGSNSHAQNAFFIRSDCLGPFKPLTCEEGYVVSRFRDSRGAAGELTFVAGERRLALIQDAQVYDLDSNSIRPIRELIPLASH